jgi:hypothetical protein
MSQKPVLYLVLCSVVVLASACSSTAGVAIPTLPAPTLPPTGSTPLAPTATTVALISSSVPASPPPASNTPPLVPTATQAPPPPVAGASFGFPPPPTGLPADLPPAQPLGRFVAFAWNNLGMHCFQQEFSMFLVLPPYNVFWTQVVARGDDPAIATRGLTA